MSDSKNINKKELLKEIEQLNIKVNLVNFMELEGRKLIEENSYLENDDIYQLKNKDYQKFRRHLKRHYFKKTKVIFNNGHIVMNRMAVILIILIATLSLSVMSVKAVRTKVFNFILDMQEEYTQIGLEENGIEFSNENNLIISWKDAFAPTLIPEGYSLSSISNNRK